MGTIFFVTLVTSASLILVIAPFFQGGKGKKHFAKEHKIPTLLKKKEEALQAIKEIEFDYLTGKLSDEDYAQLLDLYKTRARTILQEIEGSQEEVSSDSVTTLRQEVIREIRALRRKSGRNIDG